MRFRPILTEQLTLQIVYCLVMCVFEILKTNSFLGLFTMIDTQLNNSDCSCRPTDFSRSTVECVAKCIGLEEVPDAVPQVEIWGEKSGNVRTRLIYQKEIVCLTGNDSAAIRLLY